jgi:hypothetical protein
MAQEQKTYFAVYSTSHTLAGVVYCNDVEIKRLYPQTRVQIFPLVILSKTTPLNGHWDRVYYHDDSIYFGGNTPFEAQQCYAALQLVQLQAYDANDLKTVPVCTVDLFHLIRQQAGY